MEKTLSGTSRDCRYCEYATCADGGGYVSCYSEDGEYFSHRVEDPREAEWCGMFRRREEAED